MKLARRIGHRLGDLLFPPGSERLWARRLRGQVLCLLYHRVDASGRVPFLDRSGLPVTAPGELERDLAFWRRLGARFGTFRDLRAGWFPGAHEVGIVVCFDDGFQDNYTHGLDVLARLGVPATMFQTAGQVGASELTWEHAIYFHLHRHESAARFRGLAREVVPDAIGGNGGRSSLEDALRMRASRERIEGLVARAFEELGGREEARAWAAELYPGAAALRRWCALGHELGSHGLSHHPRARLDDAAFEDELARSRARLTELVGEPPDCYSYPFGSHRPGDDRICRRHYAQAAIVRPEPIRRDSSPWELPRATWPGPARNALRFRRWLLTGRI